MKYTNMLLIMLLVCVTTIQGMMTLSEAVAKNNALEVSNIFRMYPGGYDANTKLNGFVPLLIVAVIHNNVYIAHQLLSHQAWVNARDRMDRTPLIHAVQQGNADMVKLLWQYGAQTELVDYWGNAAINYALGLPESPAKNIILSYLAPQQPGIFTIS